MARKKMNQEAKAKWLKALRSNKYQQGRGNLRNKVYGDKHCCLGVLCSVSGKGRWSRTNNSAFKYNYKGESGVGALPAELLDELNITEKTQSKLIQMNDTYGYDFDKIADWVETNI